MSDSSEDEEKRSNRKAKSAMDIQRLQLEKLMSEPLKEVIIPEMKKDSKLPRAFNPHEFVRNVMGASAGAGSGEFDIYRGCRRREQIRQEFLTAEDEKKKALEEFEEKRLAHLKEAEEKTAKKRAKRLKQKSNMKKKKHNKNNHVEDDDKSNDEDNASQNSQEEIDLSEKVEENNEKVKEVEKVNS